MLKRGHVGEWLKREMDIGDGTSSEVQAAESRRFLSDV